MRALLCALLGVWVGAAIAHPPPRTTVREVIRIQGTRGAAAGGSRRVTFAALGTEHEFGASTWQVLGFGEGAAAPEPERPRYTLEADRETLARFAAARPEQTVTLLVDRRPGKETLFVLALDLCPPR